jgi:hypothetical protein
VNRIRTVRLPPPMFDEFYARGAGSAIRMSLSSSVGIIPRPR